MFQTGYCVDKDIWDTHAAVVIYCMVQDVWITHVKLVTMSPRMSGTHVSD